MMLKKHIIRLAVPSLNGRRHPVTKNSPAADGCGVWNWFNLLLFFRHQIVIVVVIVPRRWDE